MKESTRIQHPGPAARCRSLKYQLVGEHGAGVEHAVSVIVDEPNDAIGRVLALDLQRLIRTAGIGDVQSTKFVKVGADWSIDQGRSRN